jgi:hypothetical protein
MDVGVVQVVAAREDVVIAGALVRLWLAVVDLDTTQQVRGDLKESAAGVDDNVLARGSASG